MNKIWGALTIIIGLFLLIGSVKKSDFIIFKLLVARAKILWGKNVYTFFMVSSILIMVFGILMVIGVFG